MFGVFTSHKKQVGDLHWRVEADQMLRQVRYDYYAITNFWKSLHQHPSFESCF